MSVQALSCAMVVRDVTASEKLLLLVLANYADERMTSWPSHKRMAADACLTERTILTLLKGLELKRLISRKERFRADGSRTTDAITLHFSGEVTSPPPEPAAGHGEAGNTGVGKPAAPGGAQISPLTTFDPSSEPSKEPSVARSRRPSRFVPDDWSPSDATRAALAGEGFMAGDLERALTKMRDHEFAKPHSRWDAAFRNWVRNDRDRKPRLIHERPDPSTAKLDAKQANYARAWEGSERAFGRDREP